MADTTISKPSVYDISAWLVAVVGLWLVFDLHLLPALLSGLLVYELIHLSAPLLRVSRLSDNRAKLVVVALLAFFIISLLIILVWWGIHFFGVTQSACRLCCNGWPTSLKKPEPNCRSG